MTSDTTILLAILALVAKPILETFGIFKPKVNGIEAKYEVIIRLLEHQADIMDRMSVILTKLEERVK